MLHSLRVFGRGRSWKSYAEYTAWGNSSLFTSDTIKNLSLYPDHLKTPLLSLHASHPRAEDLSSMRLPRRKALFILDCVLETTTTAEQNGGSEGKKQGSLFLAPPFPNRSWLLHAVAGCVMMLRWPKGVESVGLIVQPTQFFLFSR